MEGRAEHGWGWAYPFFTGREFTLGCCGSTAHAAAPANACAPDSQLSERARQRRALLDGTRVAAPLAE
jgi:hypothetical protein